MQNPDGQIVLVVVNSERSAREVTIASGLNKASVRLPKQSIATFAWTTDGRSLREHKTPTGTESEE